MSKRPRSKSAWSREAAMGLDQQNLKLLRAMQDAVSDEAYSPDNLWIRLSRKEKKGLEEKAETIGWPMTDIVRGQIRILLSRESVSAHPPNGERETPVQTPPEARVGSSELLHKEDTAIQPVLDAVADGQHGSSRKISISTGFTPEERREFDPSKVDMWNYRLVILRSEGR